VTGSSALPSADGDARPSLGDSAKVVAWGLVFWGGVQVAAAGLERNAVAMVVVQAAVAEWGAGRMGIPWSDPRASPPRWEAIARRAAIGAALGAGCAVLASGLAIGVRQAVVGAGEPAMGALLVGLFMAAMGAVRDELLLRGVVLRATQQLLPMGAALVACGLAAAAARLGIDGAITPALFSEALRGTALGAIWTRDKGAWMACAANAAWTWTMGPVLGGNLLDVRFATEPGSASAAIAVLAVATLVACLWAAGKLPRPRAAS
jgi:hypothetical protein